MIASLSNSVEVLLAPIAIGASCAEGGLLNKVPTVEVSDTTEV